MKSGKPDIPLRPTDTSEQPSTDVLETIAHARGPRTNRLSRCPETIRPLSAHAIRQLKERTQMKDPINLTHIFGRGTAS
jgi:hypothetical protein